MNIKRKLFYGFGVVGLLFVGVVVLYQITLSHTITNINLLLNEIEGGKDHTENARLYVQEALRKERDFLASHNLKCAEEGISLAGIAKREAEELKLHHFEKYNLNFKGEDELIKSIDQYMEKFSNIRDLVQKKGLDHNSGLQGEFRNAAHELEGIIKNKKIIPVEDYLMLRKHEKDYLLRLDRNYQKEVNFLLITMNQKIDESGIPKDEKLTLHYLLDSYKQKFNQLVDVDSLIDNSNIELRYIENKMESQLVTILKDAEKIKEEISVSAVNTPKQQANIAMLVSICILFISIILIFIFTNSISKPLINLKSSMAQLSQGNLEVQLGDFGKDEIGDLASTFKKMAQDLYAKTIENERQYWLKTGQAELNDKMRNATSLSELGHNIISYLAPYVNAQVGAIYLEDGEESFRMVSNYAYNKRKNLSNKISIGEGLIGQSALEGHYILLTNVPDDYIKINSGLGETAPRNIIVMPFLFNGKVKGIIELGSIQEFTKIHIEFLASISEAVGIAFNTIQTNRTKELLEKTKILAEKLQAQQDELIAANKELEAQTNYLKESEARLQIQQEELKATNEELEEQTQALRSSEDRLQVQQEELQAANEELEERAEAIEKQKANIQQKNDELEKAYRLIQDKVQQLHSINKYKSEFLANMSHELRTPLNSLLILSQQLAENKAGNLTEKQVEYAHTIYSSGSDLLNLINDILDLSKVEAGKMRLNVEDVHLADLIEHIKQNIMPLVLKKGLSFDINISQDLPVNIHTDSQRVNQIIKNLLSNAIKFTSKGGITVNIGRPSNPADISHYGLNPKTTVAIAVTDTGIGIPKNKRDLIFEAFQQADGSISRKYGGTGLGLSLSKELAGFLGGAINLQSEEGKGSTFILYLPEKCPKKPDSEQSVTSSNSLEFPDQGHLVEKATAEQNISEVQPGAALKGSTTNSASKVDYDKSSEKTIVEKPEQENHSAACSTILQTIPDDRNQLAPGDKTVLVVEDDPSFAQILLDTAHEKGFKCLVAGDGETGLKLAESYKPTAIILDISLPGIDGWTVMERLKDNPATRNIPVNFMSALEKSLDAMKMGAIGFFTKPVNIQDMDSAFKNIEDVISQKIKRLLIVEDNEEQKCNILKLIEGLNIHVSVVDDGRKAYEKLKAEKFDGLILNPWLANNSGFELLEKINSNGISSSVSVIIYTAKTLSAQEKEQILKYGKKIPIKKANSPEKLLDDVVLFLHLVESNLPEDKQNMLKMIHDKEAVLRDKKVLLVDDDIRNVFALSSVLEEKGMKVFVGKNGKDCLDFLDKNPAIDLVLMDIMMPEMDGYEATRQIRKQPKFDNLPIIALTAKAMKGDRAKCIEAGANDYLAKPVEIDKLLSLLRVWLYRSGDIS